MKLARPKLPIRRKQIKPTTAKPMSHKRYLVRRIIMMNIISLFIVVFTYASMVLFLSKISRFWDLFRHTEAPAQNVFAPPAPYLNSIAEATQNATIDVSGQTEAGRKVQLFIDSSKNQEIVADSTGMFTFTGVPIGVFPTKIYVKAVNDQGMESPNSTEYSIVQDKLPPTLEITVPAKKSEEYKNTEHAYVVSGTTEPEATVTVNDQIAIVDTLGEFSASIRLNDGNNKITITAKDKAQNETTEERFVKFTKVD